MRVSRLVTIFAGSMLAIAAQTVSAQVSGIVTSSFVPSPLDTANGNRQPYTATWSNKQVQTLANGTTITHDTTTRYARDSSGRTYMEVHNALPAGQDGQPRELVNYHVSDPVAHTTTMWNSSEKRVTVVHQPEPQMMQARPAPEGQNTVTVPPRGTPAEPRAAHTQPDVQREELGTKNIAGINAKGVRTTRVIAAGREGNDQPITVIEENWRSPEYGLILMSVRDDPRYGITTREVTEFQAGEPDAALFHAPEGYTIHDIPVRTVGVQ